MSIKSLLLRFSDFHGVDTIASHSQVISQEGFCWWAKLGKQPTPQYLSEFLDQAEKTVFLYTSNSLYACKLGKVIWERPRTNYPQYYEHDIFGCNNEPKLYFQLLSLEKIEMSVLSDYVVCVSGKEVTHDLKKSISSYMFIQDKNIPIVKRSSKGSIQKPKPKTITVNNTCIYNKDGLCTNRRCINYQYECERPNNCVKQKPIIKEIQ